MTPTQTRSPIRRAFPKILAVFSSLASMACLIGLLLGAFLWGIPLDEWDMVVWSRIEPDSNLEWEAAISIDSGKVWFEYYEVGSLSQGKGPGPFALHPGGHLSCPGVFRWTRTRDETWVDYSIAIDFELYLWFPALLFAIYPFIVFVHRPRRRRRRCRLRRGLCLTCGYDVTSGGQTVCPECGTAADSDHRIAAIPGGGA